MNGTRAGWVLVAIIGSLACRGGTHATAPAATAPIPAGAIAVTVDGAGYHPPVVTVPHGGPVTMVFTRTSDDGCGDQLVFPDLNVRRDLPLNRPVVVTVTAPPTGRLAFTCGMNMYRGAVVVQ